MTRDNEAQLQTLQAATRLEARPSVSVDYSEEAIPERDPAYRLPGGTVPEEQTVDAMPPHLRAGLARQLMQLGMSEARAMAVVSM
jgi:hypothetical protein